MLTRLLSGLNFAYAACGFCVIACCVSPVSAQTKTPASDIASDDEIATMLKFAELAQANGVLDKAADIFGIAMNMSSADDAKLRQTLTIALQYAHALHAIDANSEAVCIYNWIGRAAPGPRLPFKRAALFQELGWDSAMLSE